MEGLSEILEQIQNKHHIAIKNQGRYYLITCPFHSNGSEAHPSCLFNVTDSRYPVGFFNCLACGAKGTLKDLLQVYFEDSRIESLLSLVSAENIKCSQMQSFLKEAPEQKQKQDIVNYLDVAPNSLKNNEWRGIPYDTLKLYDAKIKGENELIFPVYSADFSFTMFNIIGYVTALIVPSKNKKIPNYKNSAGQWVSNAFFNVKALKSLLEKTEKTNSDNLYIVEGERDTMNLTRLGIPSLAILGCKNYSKDLNNYLLFIKRQFNFKRIVLLMDGDKAGREANVAIYNKIKRSYLFKPQEITIKYLPYNMDPAMITEKDLDLIKID